MSFRAGFARSGEAGEIQLSPVRDCMARLVRLIPTGDAQRATKEKGLQ
jgi:hypothetical protein